MNYLTRPRASLLLSYLGNSPVTVADVKLQARVDHADEDALIAALIDASVEACELQLQRKVRRQRVRLSFDRLGSKMLLSGLGPEAEILSVTYRANKATVTLPASAYSVYPDSAPYISIPDVPASDVDNQLVTVEANAGMATVPASISQWIKIYAATLYVTREMVTTGSATTLGFVDNLLDPHRLPLV